MRKPSQDLYVGVWQEEGNKLKQEVLAGYQQKLFPSEGSPAGEKVSQRAGIISILGVFNTQMDKILSNLV